MAKLHRDDLIEATLDWVVGACWKWNVQTNCFTLAEERAFQEFCLRTHHVVWSYLQGRKALDGSCSDLECTLAIRAKHVFGHHLED